MINYPPGVSDSTYGAPWNDIEEEREVTITLKACISVSFQGPARISEYEIVESIKKVGEEDLKKTSENYEIESIELTESKEPYKVAVYWSVEDFESLAIEEKGVEWEKYYDKSKFEDALDNMIRKHDATEGINWYTVRFWLEESCRRLEPIEEEE